MIRRLICANFDSSSKFVTLTFRDDVGHDITDIKACNRFFYLFVKRLKYRFPDLAYLAVIEFQDKNGRGAVHYHMICNLPYIKKSELAEIWRGGFVKINAIDKVDNVGAYVIKYMCKDTEDMRLQGENAYLHSKGLLKPIQITSWSSPRDCHEMLDFLEKESPSYTAMYESEYIGLIEYMQYNLNRVPLSDDNDTTK